MKVGLLDACADPQLFGIDLWPRQKEILAEVERGPRLHVWALRAVNGHRSQREPASIVTFR